MKEILTNGCPKCQQREGDGKSKVNATITQSLAASGVEKSNWEVKRHRVIIAFPNPKSTEKI